MKKRHIALALPILLGLASCNFEFPQIVIPGLTPENGASETSEIVSSFVEDSTGASDELDTDQIRAVYALYQENGGTLSYEEWLATIKGEKGDKANLWLLDCEFDNPAFEHGQEEDNPKSMSMNFFVSNRTVAGDELFFVKVPSTAAAYVAPGTEPTTSSLPVPVAAS